MRAIPRALPWAGVGCPVGAEDGMPRWGRIGTLGWKMGWPVGAKMEGPVGAKMEGPVGAEDGLRRHGQPTFSHRSLIRPAKAFPISGGCLAGDHAEAAREMALIVKAKGCREVREIPIGGG